MNKNSCSYCGAKPGNPCSGYGLNTGECHDVRSFNPLILDLLAACERVLERWDTHDGQMNHVDDVRDAVKRATSSAQR